MEELNFESMLGKRVTLKGIAKNSKAGAVIVLSNGEPVWIRGQSEWSEDKLDHEIELEGVLRLEKYIPDPYFSEDGGISQGAEGQQYTLELT